MSSSNAKHRHSIAFAPQLSEKLLHYRRTRSFDPCRYLNQKALMINRYFAQFDLSTAVVGVSGGIDSAVVTGILHHASKISNSPIKKIIPTLLPFRDSPGATNQSRATLRGQKVAKQFGLNAIEIDLSKAIQATKSLCDQATETIGNNWACGQLVSYLRTPVLYYLCSVLSTQGENSVVCGTTNRDEGAYIGFFGKASDAMVDLQLISDIHKSEVYQLAELLKIPSEIVEATPSGDVYDGRVDQEMIGAPYDFVELYMHLLCDTPANRLGFTESLIHDAKSQFNAKRDAVEALHVKNSHKYLGSSSAIHFDIYERAVPNGWKQTTGLSQEIYEQLRGDPILMSALPLLATERNLKRAGFFLESHLPGEKSSSDLDLHWYCTPLYHVRRRLKQYSNSSRPKAVLLTTGAFCPIHNGHIYMLETAKTTLEQRGYDVLGGFISPTHDEYVYKKCTKHALPAQHRISLCRSQLNTNDWIEVDTWESLYAGREVNFTKTTWRLAEYLRTHLDCDDIEVFYTCGGDHAEYCLSFVSSFGCVVIPRNEQERQIMQQLQRDSLVQNNTKIILATAAKTHQASSTSIRLGELDALGKSARDCWLRWSKSQTISAKSAYLQLRDEGISTLRSWGESVSYAKLKGARKFFILGLTELLKQSFSKAHSPDSTHQLAVGISTWKDQRNAITEMNLGPTISIDTLFRGDYQIECSRYFELGNAFAFKGVFQRPGAASLAEQIAQIPNGQYSLIEDDRATGSTLRKVLKLGENHFEIKDIVLLARLSKPRGFSGEVAYDIYDLGDVRDFLPGAPGGGLVVDLPDGKVGRAPYMLPYVQPSARLSAPISTDLLISKRIWELAADFYRAVPITVKDTDPDLQRTIEAVGLHFNSMQELCSWHAEQINYF